MKRAYTDGQLAIIEDAATRLVPHDPESARVQAVGVLALMVGTLQARFDCEPTRRRSRTLLA